MVKETFTSTAESMMLYRINHFAGKDKAGHRIPGDKDNNAGHSLDSFYQSWYYQIKALYLVCTKLVVYGQGPI